MTDKRKPGKPESRPARQDDMDLIGAFDPRMMEKQMGAITRLLEQQEFTSQEEVETFLESLIAGSAPIEVEPSTPLERAQEIVYQALEMADGRRRRELARSALEISADCADAYVLLAEGETNLQAARRYFQQGVEAGERALGVEVFEQAAGMFWGVLETRPYMRARQGLAMVLWRLGEHQAAIEHAREMLRLNPGDNQGIRYALAAWLLLTSEHAGLESLLAQYPDEWSANWAYNRVLLTYRQSGAGRKADTALKRALEVNPYVPLHLLGVAPPPKRAPEYYGMGDENEAILYTLGAFQAWEDTKDALQWLNGAALRIALTPRPARAPRAPGGAPRKPAKRGWRLVKPESAE